MRLIDAYRLLSDRMKSKYYHLPNGDIAVPIIDIEHAPTFEVPVVLCKDCKFSVMTYVGEVKYCKCWHRDEDGNYDGEPLYLDGDFYCGFAKPKEK